MSAANTAAVSLPTEQVTIPALVVPLGPSLAASMLHTALARDCCQRLLASVTFRFSDNQERQE